LLWQFSTVYEWDGIKGNSLPKTIVGWVEYYQMYLRLKWIRTL
jgi:hypothetical protein